MSTGPDSSPTSGPRSPGELLSQNQRLAYILVLGMLMAMGPFTIDLYLPALPMIKDSFGVGAAAVQLTLTGTLVGFASGQLVMGPLSDKVGRKLPLVVAAGVHITASLGAALAPSIEFLMVMRVLQGFGAASSSVVTMAIVRDLFAGRPLVVMLSRMALVNGLAPVIAPLLGSQLLVFMDWRGIFVVLAGYSLIAALLVRFYVAETLPPQRHRQHQKTLWQRYQALFQDRTYLGIIVVAGMNATGLFSYLSASPFLFQDVYGFSPQMFGLLFAVNSVGVIIGVQTSARLMRYGTVPAQWVLVGTTAAQIVLGSLIFISDWAGLGMWGTLIPLGLFITACGFAFPAVQYLALADHGAEAGTAASLLGAVNFGLAGALTPIIGLLGVNSAQPMAGLMTASAVVGAAVLWIVVRPRQVANTLG